MSLRRIRLMAGTVLTIATVSGCGAPSIQTMHSQFKKQAAAVFLLNQPSFVSQKSLSAKPYQGTNVTEVLPVTTSSFQASVHKVLQENGVTTLLVAGDNLQPISQTLQSVLSSHANLHVDLVSNTQLSLPPQPNLYVITQNSSAVSYAIGWLVGQWANTEVQTLKLTQQPSIGFYAGSTTNQNRKAFFAGLYNANPVARVVNMTPLNGPNATTPIYPTVSAVVVGSQPKSQLVNQLNVNQPTIFSLSNQTGLSLPTAIQPGHIEPTHFQTMLSEFGQGQWKSGIESVIDKSSVQINAQFMPKEVVTAWSSVEPSLSAKPSQWQQTYSRLPAQTRKSIQTQFGVQ